MHVPACLTLAVLFLGTITRSTFFSASAVLAAPSADSGPVLPSAPSCSTAKKKGCVTEGKGKVKDRGVAALLWQGLHGSGVPAPCAQAQTHTSRWSVECPHGSQASLWECACYHPCTNIKVVANVGSSNGSHMRSMCCPCKNQTHESLSSMPRVRLWHTTLALLAPSSDQLSPLMTSTAKTLTILIPEDPCVSIRHTSYPVPRHWSHVPHTHRTQNTQP